MRTKTQLELLRKLRQRKGLAKGFTLVELMIVVAIVGILSAVAIPQFLGARNAAAAGAAVGEAIGLAKECATFVASGGVGQAPTIPTPFTGSCASTGGTLTKAFGSATSNTVGGMNCLTLSGVTARSQVSITVTSTGGMTCALS